VWYKPENRNYLPTSTRLAEPPPSPAVGPHVRSSLQTQFPSFSSIIMKIDHRLALLSVAMLAFATFNSHPAQGAAILFVGGGVTPTLTDANVISRLTNFGNTVTYVRSLDSTTASATGQNAVVISSTVPSGEVTNKFADVTIGVLNWEQALQQQSRMNLLTEIAERGSDGTFMQLTIISAGESSPLAAGLAAGLYTVTNAAGPFSYGNSAGFGSGATGVAVRGDGSGLEANRFGIYGYDTGSIRPDGSASPGRRVQFFMGDTTFDSLNATGLQLFDAAAQYVGATVPEPSIGALAGIGLAALLGLRKRRLRS
jgi:PEP-CTERM motif